MNSRHCEQHPTHPCVYFCSDASCRTTLCELCLSGHTSDHKDKIIKMEELLQEIVSKVEIKSHLKFDPVLREKCQLICDKSFQDLIKQNSVDFDKEDLVDLVVDTAVHKLFSLLAEETKPKSKEIFEEKKTLVGQPNTLSSTKKTGQRLNIAGGYNIETGNDFPEYKYWSDKELKNLYGSDYIFPQVDDGLQVCFVKSQNKIVLASRLYKLCCVKDLENKSAPPTFFRIASGNSETSAFHILDFLGKIILLVKLKSKLLVYDLKTSGMGQEFPGEPEDENQEEEFVEDEDELENDEFEDDFEGDDVWACAGYDKDPTQKAHKTIKAVIHNLSIAKQFTFGERFMIIGSDKKSQVAISDFSQNKKVNIYKLTHEGGTYQLTCKYTLDLPSDCSRVTIDDLNNLILVFCYPNLLVYKEQNGKLSLLTEVKGTKDRTSISDYSWNKHNQLLLMNNYKIYKFSNGSLIQIKTLPKIDRPVMTRKGVVGFVNRNEFSFFPLSNLELDAGVPIKTLDHKPAIEILRNRQILLKETPKKEFSPRSVGIKILDDNEDEMLIYVHSDVSFERENQGGDEIILTNQLIYAYRY